MLFIILSFSDLTAQMSWEMQESGTSATLGDAFIIDSLTAFVVGSSGTILRTIDGGQTWEGQTSGTTETLWGVWFVSPDTGVVAGGNGTILMTTDGGTTWTPKASGTTDFLYRVCFINHDLGLIAAGQAGILRTDDSGMTWNPITIETNTNFTDVWFSDKNIATAVGTGGDIYRSIDGGESWEAQDSGTGHLLYGVSFSGPDTGYAVGGDVSSGNIVVSTTDGSANWTTNLEPEFYPRDVFCIDKNVATIVGEGEIIHTTDGGAHWENQTYSPANTLYGVYFLNSRIGIAVGANGSIYWTTDGGGSVAVESETTLSTKFELTQNYPNPFNPITTIRYALPRDVDVQLVVYDITGRQVKTLVNKRQSAGHYSIQWNGKNDNGQSVSSGIYIYQIAMG